jgi:hypothetical protein
MGWGPLGMGADHDEELANALGITLEELQAAKAEVQKRVLDEAVAAGKITQEEADLMQARQALQDYLHDRLQTAYEQLVQQAVTDGVITQAQADQILSEQGPGFFGLRMGDGPRIHGPRGMHPHGGPGRGLDLLPNDAPLQPDNGATEESNAPVIPTINTNL